ncbi:cytochrome P450 [Lophiostoma macrostomum CBS 122681]|uniref:Cytochrome P450 n=1 Tax=Lophiostoma macrostomum CBS 122681 TaxID=1314788 RepID=A0A6A6SVJ0_9PLEO|nr:cytochrome P450 [Lophiostoma macrostomum CBS 122681]
MLSQALVALTALVAPWTLWSWYSLYQNYRIARKIGVPLRIIPISHENPLWMAVDKRIFIPLFERLPFGSGTFTRFNWRGWEFADKYKSHLEMGDVFMVVTPGRNWLYVCDPQALEVIFQRRGDFPRPLEIFEMVNIFGANLSTTDGQDWQKHRKVTAGAFNEQNNEAAWHEGVQQARDMVTYWASKKTIRSTADDTRTFSLNVLSSAGFGKSYPFQGHEEQSTTERAANYKDSLQTILDNCILLFILGTGLISTKCMPRKISNLHRAVVNFKTYMTEVYEAEKAAISKGTSTSKNLMSALIRASQDHRDGGLSESEIYGNMFLFNFAGHDTTSHTLAFAIVLLATQPTVQTWIHEELCHVLGERSADEWSYTNDFPGLKRCLAVMLETLRLYTPVPIAKSTGKNDAHLRVRRETYVIPRNTLVIPHHVAVHTHPKYWGGDSLEWRPSRWITRDEHPASPLDGEKVVTPRKGSFLAWTEGLRVCPGKKFSQVEFVAAIAAVFRDWYVEPVRLGGESMEDARRRVAKLVEEDTGQVLLLQMLHPEKAPLVWKRR